MFFKHLLLIVLISVSPLVLLAQGSAIYQYPQPNSVEVSPTTGIGIRTSGTFDRVRTTASSMSVVGSRSGVHKLMLKFSRDQQMAVATPIAPFSLGESVSVRFNGILAGGAHLLDTFRFTTQIHRAITSFSPYSGSIDRSGSVAVNAQYDSTAIEPDMTVLTDNGATPGSIFMANMQFIPVPNSNWLYVLDEHGKTRTKALLQDSHAQDFKKQANGTYTYYDDEHSKFYALDTNFSLVDSFEIQHGYLPDGHELLVFADGGAMMLGFSETAKDMSQQVSGGFYDANIVGSIIQEFDADKNVIFEWRGVDHFDVLDAVHENLTAPTVEFEHANSLDVDRDNNIIISNRHLSEISKIDRRKGYFIWRLGGIHNQFKFINDSLGFSYQHDARLLPNGHLTLLDNGNFHARPESRAVEYEIDTTNMTARLVWEYRHTPAIFSFGMGSVQRLANGNTLIGWGASDTTMTEVRPDNSIAFEMSMSHNNFSYRVQKYTSDAASAVANAKPSTVALSYAADTRTLTLPVDVAAVAIYDLLGREVVAYSSLDRIGTRRLDLKPLHLQAGAYLCSTRTMAGVIESAKFVVTE